MSKYRCAGSFAALATAVLVCGGAHADPMLSFLQPPTQTEITQQQQQQIQPQAAASDTGDENGQLAPRLQKQIVNYATEEAPGTIIVDTPHTFLYYVLGNGKALRYGIGVGREGFTWAGVKSVVRKTEWPDWYPPSEMLQRQPYLPRMMAGGPGNPLGARAMYIGGTEYRIHGTNDPATIGKHVSSGCIRMTNDNAIDLYNRVQVGAKVIVLPQTAEPTHEAMAPVETWQTKAQAAIERARRSEPHQSSYAPVRESRAHMSWNEGQPAGLY
jgi:lipoprotein-anchoring transpeptidase ErfK/SrfK